MKKRQPNETMLNPTTEARYEFPIFKVYLNINGY